MSKQLKVLAVGAHPDDLDLQCVGTLIRYVKEGHKVTMAIACTGNVGSKDLTGPEIEAVRAIESQRSAKVVGAELVMLGYRDAEVWLDNPTWKRFVDLIRQVDPDVIITHDTGDYVHDHSNVGELAYRAAIWASVHNIPDCKYPPITHIPTLYFMENLGTQRSDPPTLYVDITAEYEQKLEAFRQHDSQHGDFLEKQFGVSNWFEYLEAVAKLRGFQCGCKYAEAFRPPLTWPNPKPYRLLPPVQYGSR